METVAIDSSGQSLSSSFFELLPFDLYSRLQSFLYHLDYRRFLSSNKSLFREIKRRTVYYNLSLSGSIRFVQSEDFRRSVLSMIESKSSQVSIHLTLDYYDIKSRYFYCHIAGVHSANIHSFQFHALLPFLSHISILYLENGEDVVEFPFLAALKRVTLKKFRRLREIRRLSHLEEVQLVSCPLIRDVEPLAQVSTVLLEDCSAIESVAVLGAQQRLTLIRCGEIKSVASLGAVRYLSLQQCLQITELDFTPSSQMYSLQLTNLPSISSLPETLQLRELTIQNCTQILDYDALPAQLLRIHLTNSLVSCLSAVFSACQSVKLVGCPYLEDVSPLAEVSRVHLEKCWKLSSVEMLGRVITLALLDCPMVTSLAGLGSGNHRITLGQCPNILDFQPLQAIPDIHLLDLPQPIDVSCFSLARLLTLQNCPNLLFLSRLQQFCPCLHTLRLIHCRTVSDLHDLWKIPVIVVQNCPNLTDFNTGPSASFFPSEGGHKRVEREKPRILFEGDPCIHTIKILHAS